MAEIDLSVNTYCVLAIFQKSCSSLVYCSVTLFFAVLFISILKLVQMHYASRLDRKPSTHLKPSFLVPAATELHQKILGHTSETQKTPLFFQNPHQGQPKLLSHSQHPLESLPHHRHSFKRTNTPSRASHHAKAITARISDFHYYPGK